MKIYIFLGCLSMAIFICDNIFGSVPAAIYIDLNATVNGDGLTAEHPTNQLPSANITANTQLFFNSDNGVQTIPTGRDNTFFIIGSDVEISSYGSGRATISGYQVFSGGWTRVGTSNAWQRSFSGGPSGSGNVVGNVIDLSSTRESPTGDVLKWYNLEINGGKIGAFQADPTVLPVGFYAYDWQNQVMYINVGADPNNRSIGISQVGRLFNTTADVSPANVKIHGLRMIGFARAVMNIGGHSNHWRIYDNELYGNGGMYNTRANWYHGSGIQPTQNANNIEIDHNRIVQTYDSPITPQHFGGSSGDTLRDINIHHNYVDRWALGGVELADWGRSNTFMNITIEDNTFINGGKGFSGTGDTPQGKTDGIQIYGGNSGTSRMSGLVIRRNNISSHDAAFVIGGNTFPEGVILEDNTLWGSAYGIRNLRTSTAFVVATGNTICGNKIQIEDSASGSHYSNNKLSAVCSTR